MLHLVVRIVTIGS